jgi:hypothetical protein
MAGYISVRILNLTGSSVMSRYGSNKGILRNDGSRSPKNSLKSASFIGSDNSDHLSQHYEITKPSSNEASDIFNVYPEQPIFMFDQNTHYGQYSGDLPQVRKRSLLWCLSCPADVRLQRQFIISAYVF